MSTQKRHASFLRKIFFYFILISLLLTVLLTALLSFVSIQNTVELINRFSAKLIMQTNYSITYLNEVSSRVGKALLGDPTIISFLNMKQHDKLAVIQASHTLDRQLLTLDGFDSIYLYNAGLDLMYSSKTGEQRQSAEFSDQETVAWLTNPEIVSGQDNLHFIQTGAKEETVAICAYPVFESLPLENGLRNTIVINISTSMLTQSLRSMTSANDETTFLVLDENGRQMSAAYGKRWGDADTNRMHALLQRVSEASESGSMLERADGVYYMLNYSQHNANGWMIVGVTPMASILQPMIPSTIAALAIVLVIFAGSLLAAYFLSRRIYTPIQAIRDVLSGKDAQRSAPALNDTEDFSYILSVFDGMRKQNEQLDRIRRENSQSERQNLLVSLLSGSAQPGSEETRRRQQKLELMGLSTEALCMCLFKIDRYSQVAAGNSRQERWALRFAIVKVIQEVAEDHFRCEVFNCSSDKFAMLVYCAEPFKTFQEKLTAALREIQLNVSDCFGITVSCAYSTPFKGAENLQSVYETMQSSILLKLRYGHNCIISPFMLDEIDAGDFTLTMKQEGQFTERALNGDKAAAMESYSSIGRKLYCYAYDEILSCELHLAYTLYLAVMERYPEFRGGQGMPLKRFMRDLQNAEVSADVDAAMDKYLTVVCDAINQSRDQNRLQRCQQLSGRVEEIVEREYADPGLCLSAIAEQLHLSPNYVGHLFKAERQISIAQYILDTRMNKLAELLRLSDQPINDMLEQVGMEKSNYFYTLFKKHFGCSLSEYRQQTHQG